MSSIYDGFHLSRLDFDLEKMGSLPTWQLALVFAHPLATPTHKERAELYFGRARERDRIRGLAIGSNEERALKAEQALRREEDVETLLQRVKPEPGTEEEPPAASTSAVHSNTTPPASTPPRAGRSNPPAVEPRNSSQASPPPLPAFGPPLRYGALASPPLRNVEADPRQREAAATAYGARAPSQPSEPRAGPSYSHAGHHPPPIHYPSYPPLAPPSPEPLPLPDQQAPVPSAFLSSLSCLTITIPSIHITTTLIRLFLLRPARNYGPMPIFISDPYSYASPGTPPKDVFFFVAYRTSEDALQAQRANEGKGLPSLNASGSLPLSVVTSGPADRIGDLTNSLRWEHVWPVAQRSYLAYGIIPPFEGVPPTPEKGVVVSERYQAEARKVKEEMRVAELARMREGGMAPVQVQGQGRGGRGRGADGEGGGGKQQKKQERKKRLRENARARGNGGQQQAASSNGGGAGGHQHYNDPPQQQYDQFYSSNHHDGEREHFSGAEVGYDAAGGAQDDCDPQGRYDDYQDDDGQEYESEDEPGSLPFAFPFPSAKGREGKRARFS